MKIELLVWTREKLPQWTFEFVEILQNLFQFRIRLNTKGYSVYWQIVVDRRLSEDVLPFQ